MKGVILLIGVLIGVLAAVALAPAFLGIRRCFRSRARAGNATRFAKPAEAVYQEPTARAAAPDLKALLCGTMRRELSLASEHVHSIRWLLEIARQHQQPIPSAALTNLELVSKHLGEMQRRLDLASVEPISEANISPSAHCQETRTPLRPRQPSFGCHVSPSDISTPCD